MDLERIDALLSQLYNQAVGLQEMVRLIQVGKVHDVSFTPDQIAQFTQKGSTGLGNLRAIVDDLEAEFGAA